MSGNIQVQEVRDINDRKYKNLKVKGRRGIKNVKSKTVNKKGLVNRMLIWQSIQDMEIGKSDNVLENKDLTLRKVAQMKVQVGQKGVTTSSVVKEDDLSKDSIHDGNNEILEYTNDILDRRVGSKNIKR